MPGFGGRGGSPGTYIVVGTNSNVARSNNGVDWNVFTVGVGLQWNYVTYDYTNRRWLISGNGGNVYYSDDDGTTWNAGTAVPAAISNFGYRVVYFPPANLYCWFGVQELFTSPDLATWTLRTYPSMSTGTPDVTIGPPDTLYFVPNNIQQDVGKSTNGTSWTKVAAGTTARVITSNGTYVLTYDGSTGSPYRVNYSTDGSSWNNSTISDSNAVASSELAKFTGGYWCFCGSTHGGSFANPAITRSTTHNSGYLRIPLRTGSFNNICEGVASNQQGQFVAVDNGGGIFTTDQTFASFTQVMAPGSYNWRAVAHSREVYV